MGKHQRKTDWERLTPEQKIDAFDRQWADSVASGDEKRSKGEYPYDLDKKVEKRRTN